MGQFDTLNALASILVTAKIDSENIKMLLADVLRSPIASADILSSNLAVEGLGAASIASEGPSILGTALAGLATGVVASLLPILGGIGFPLGLIVGAAAFAVGSAALRGEINNIEIPVRLRRSSLSDERIDKLMSELDARIESDTHEALTQWAKQAVGSLITSIEGDLLGTAGFDVQGHPVPAVSAWEGPLWHVPPAP